MDELVLATADCDPARDIICAPSNVLELFELPRIFSIGGFDINRTVLLTFLAMGIVLFVLWWGLRDRGSLVPTKFGAAVEGIVNFVRNEVAIDIIGPEGARYAPYLLSVFMLVIVSNLFEVTPLINFPITSRMALPLFLSVVTWIIFVSVGFAKHGIRYFTDLLWPKSVPIALRPLVGLIEVVSTFILRPITLAVRLFANLVAGHLMLSLLLASGYVFLVDVFDIGFRSAIGLAWFGFGLGIYIFEIVVAVLQAYIFTLLSAVYVQSSVHPEH